MKQYIILGSNNFWYATFSAETTKEAEDYLQDIKDQSENYPVAQPEAFYLYEVKKVKELPN